MGRHDDLWSLFYMLIEFLHGSLPWRKVKDKDEVGRMKEEIQADRLLEGCPVELLDFVRHLETLTYPDAPDFDYLARCLKTVLARFVGFYFVELYTLLMLISVECNIQRRYNCGINCKILRYEGEKESECVRIH